VLGEYLERAFLLVHGGEPHPAGSGLRSVDAWASEQAARFMPAVPVLVPAVHKPRGRVAFWCATQWRAGTDVCLLAFPGGRGTEDSVRAFRHRGMAVIEVVR
jgi:hypothetical protein